MAIFAGENDFYQGPSFALSYICTTATDANCSYGGVYPSKGSVYE